MATVQQLLNLIEDMYHSATTDAVKVKYMNMCQDGMTRDFGLLATDISLETVAGQDEYAFPTGILDISQIEAFSIGNSPIGATATRYDVEQYEIGYRLDSPKSGRCIFQVADSAGVKKLVVYPIPSQSSYRITIKYRKKLKPLSATDLSASPEFDEQFHDVLAQFACWHICADGSSSDYIQANRFAAEYEATKGEMFRLLNKEKIVAPRKPRYNKVWRAGR